MLALQGSQPAEPGEAECSDHSQLAQTSTNASAVAARARRVARWNTAARGNGFTLIELLLSVSLGAIVLTAVYAAYSGALRSSQRVEQAASEIQAWRFFVERLRADLVNLRIPPGDKAIEGDSGSISFTTAETGGSLVRVRYLWQGSGPQGVIHREAIGGDRQSITAVYEGVGQVGFRYRTGDGWRDQLTGPKELPRALECTVTVGGRQRSVTIGIEVERVPAADDK